MTEQDLRKRLLALCEPQYRKFNAALLPGVENILGIRMPLLRGIAREIARGDWRSFLAGTGSLYFEERMVRGLVIGYARCDAEEKLRHVERFLPLIDNWALCDCFCWRLRAAEREPMWDFIRPRFTAAEEFEVRFAAVMGFGNFADAEHADALLGLLGEIRHEGYYARMGAAWAVSVCYVKFPEKTREWLLHAPLDDWTHNRALQKIVESNRVDAAEKAAVRAMKRRTK